MKVWLNIHQILEQACGTGQYSLDGFHHSSGNNNRDPPELGSYLIGGSRAIPNDSNSSLTTTSDSGSQRLSCGNINSTDSTVSNRRDEEAEGSDTGKKQS